jgi:hypothetical protein
MCLSALFSLSACAGATHVALPAVTSEDFSKVDACERGIRYYESSLFLLVYLDGKGGIKSDFYHLPDPSKPMAVRPYSVLSDLESEFVFDNGVLTKSVAKADETAIPKAVVAAAKDMLLAAAKEFTGFTGKNPSGFALYRVSTNGGVSFERAEVQS